MQMKNSIREERALRNWCQTVISLIQLHRLTAISMNQKHISEKDRIDFIFCTLNIAVFITACGITSYDAVIPPDYRVGILDIRLQQVLENSFQKVTDHTSRKIQNRDSAGVVTYKEHLREFTTTHHTFDRINKLNHKLSKEQLKPYDMIDINDLDDLITKGMIASENKILKR